MHQQDQAQTELYEPHQAPSPFRTVKTPKGELYGFRSDSSGVSEDLGGTRGNS